LPQQQQLAILRLTIKAEHALHRRAACAVYKCNLLFTTLDKNALTKFLYALNPAYRPFYAKELATTLLDEVYGKVKGEEDAVTNAEELLGVIFSKRRMILRLE
jgi:hypothetical protein